MTAPSTKRTTTAIAGAMTLLASSLVMLTAPAQAAEGDTTSRGVTIPAFYNPPTSLPAKNGTLVRAEPMKVALTLPTPSGKLPGKATRVMFKSTDATNKPVAVTGAYLEPEKKWTGKGKRPLVVLGAGTQGQGDQCAPSIGLEHPIGIDLKNENMSAGYEILAAYRLLDKGVAVMVSDYVGLGATDRAHTYMTRLDQAHALNDAARAALSLPGTSISKDSKIGFYGYSQGGGASGAAAELQPTYAPELNLAGAYVGAPPADLVKTIDGIDGSALAVALAWTINGMIQYNPELGYKIDVYMNQKGKDFLADSVDRCVGDGLIKYAFTKTSSLTKDGSSLAQILKKEPQMKATVDAQRIGKLKPKVPVRVATGTVDDSVPHGQARQLAVDWCKAKANVTYVPVVLPNLGDKLVLTNHFLPLIVDQGPAIDWLTDRLNGKSASSNCWSMPLQP